MELYTLISLVLGVSGGTYAALTALRTHFEQSIHDGRDNCHKQFDKVWERHRDGAISDACKKKRNVIGRAYNAWRICHVVPAVVFFVFIFVVLYGALKDWDQLDSQHQTPNTAASTNSVTTNSAAASTNNSNVSIPPNYKQSFPWKYSFQFLLVLAIVDMVCVAGAFTAWIFCWFAKKALKLQYDGVLQLEKGDAQKKEAEKIVGITTPPVPPPVTTP